MKVRGIGVHRYYVGEYVTSLETAGISIRLKRAPHTQPKKRCAVMKTQRECLSCTAERQRAEKHPGNCSIREHTSQRCS